MGQDLQVETSSPCRLMNERCLGRADDNAVETVDRGKGEPKQARATSRRYRKLTIRRAIAVRPSGP